MNVTGTPAADGAPAPGERLGDFVRETADALGGNTGRAVRSDLRIYAGWCAGESRRALPAAPETVAAFVDAMAEVRAPASVRRYVATIALAHRAVGAGGTVASPPVKLALKRMHQTNGRRQVQALGLTWPLRVRMLEAAGDRLIDDRNCALLAIAYDAMLRRSELTALQVSDLLEEVGGHGTLLVRRSKTDGEGQGEIVWVGPDSLRLVRRWRKRSGVEDGFLFRSLDKGGTVLGALPPGQVARIFKRMARRAGLPEAVVRRLSGHSARVGAAQDMIAAGIELPAILQAGRWKSASMVNRYGERLLAKRSAAAKLARKQGRK
ncbi:MAG: tyrosine-type recombinase/integrase [Rhodospirillaceae bacterium]|nr:tyrosine-type recombinase/integrase [Rhodospirillaceae bacterium]